MWDAWCPELLHPELCYTRTSNQRYVFILDISLLINIRVHLYIVTLPFSDSMVNFEVIE